MRQKNNRLLHWDGLDRWSCGAILVLAIALSYLITVLDTTAATGLQAHLPAAVAQTASPEYAAKMKMAKQLLVAGNMEKLKPLLDDLAASYPYQSEPFMIMADYYIFLQEPISAMHAFRQALDLNMDYLEKKTPLYQGKKIKNIVREAEGQVKAALTVSPADPLMLENRKEVYLMLRKLSGGCGD